MAERNILSNTCEIFKNEEFGDIRTIMIDEKPYFCGSDVAKALGYSKPNNAISMHCRATLKWGIPISGKIQEINFIPEGDVYRLIIKSKLPNTQKFESWVMDEVLPTIRKTGGYVNNDELFINTYLPYADDTTKALFSNTLQTIRLQNEQLRLKDQKIQAQENEIGYKQEVINGLTDDIDIYKKKDIINRICRKQHDNYANRYKELYRCFKELYSVDLEARCEGYNLSQVRKKDQLSVINYAEKYGYIDQLYSCCVKLYEAEVKATLIYLNDLHKNERVG